MAELLVGGTAAAATGGTAASTALTILSGVATAVSVLGTLGAANAQAEGLVQQSIMADMETGQEAVASQNRATTMKRELLRVLGENEVAVAAAGVDLTGGMAAEARRRDSEAASRALSIERDDDELRRAMLKARARGLRTKADGVRQAGLLEAFGDVAQFGFDAIERG